MSWRSSTVIFGYFASNASIKIWFNSTSPQSAYDKTISSVGIYEVVGVSSVVGAAVVGPVVKFCVVFTVVGASVVGAAVVGASVVVLLQAAKPKANNPRTAKINIFFIFTSFLF